MILGYIITAVPLLSFVLLLAFMFRDKKSLASTLSEGINRYSLLCLAAILVFFAVFAIAFVHPVEQLYFDENIYQGIALNILHSGNALWCQYGTGYLQTCFVNQLYHDIVGYDVFIAAAFAFFGASAQTAYGLELFIGILSILGVFLLASVLTRRKEVPVFSALVFSTIPELFIWSRTQAVPDMPFMMFTILTAFFFIVFAKKPSNNRLAMFLMSLALTLYTRTEGIILLPIFAVLYFVIGESGLRKNAGEKFNAAKQALSNPFSLLLILLFIILLMPIIYYSIIELRAPSYGNSSGQALFSFSNFEQNMPVNLAFITGMSSTVYPEISEINLVPLALAGAVTLAFFAKKKNRFGVLLFLGLLALSYLLFYPFFYAGSVGYGVDVRFILQVLPFLAVLSGFGIFGVGTGASYLLSRYTQRHANAVKYLAYTVLVAVLVLYPFSVYAPSFVISPNSMPQEAYPNNATSFFYSNYNAVPSNCLVFSFTPDLWYEYNRSAAQINYLTGANQSLSESFSSYSCFVLDYGYWCTVAPYQNTLCSTLTSKYNLSTLASQDNGRGSGFAFYKLLNYTP